MYFPSAPISKNYYEILGVNHSATETEIKTAYKKMALKFHPDKASLNNITVEVAEEKFKLISEANEILSNPQKRSLYNCQNSFASKPIPSNSYAYKSDFFSRNNQGFGFKHDFSSQYQYAEDFKPEYVYHNCTCYPVDIPQDILNIIISDDSKIFDTFPKEKFEKTLLESMLYKACLLGKINIVKYLIEVKKISAHLKVDNFLSFTGPIFKAAAESGNLLLVKYLYETHHADIESQGLTGGTKDTALCRAAENGHEEVVKYLLQNGAKVNPEITDSNILEKAISGNNVSIISLLINAGAEKNSFTLYDALKLGNIEIVELLLQITPGLKSHQYSNSAGIAAILSGNVELVKYLEENENLDIFEEYKYCGNIRLTVLEAGAQSRNIEMMKFLLEEKKLENEVFDFDKLRLIEIILEEALKKSYCKEKSSNNLVKFVQFLMEEKQFVLPNESLRALILKMGFSCRIEVIAYLQSYLMDNVETKKLLSTIAATGLKDLNLGELFSLFNSRLLMQGEKFYFGAEIHSHIKNMNMSIDQLKDVFSGNQKLMTEALFYYSSKYFTDDQSTLKLLYELGVNLDSENCHGEAAIHVVINYGGSYNEKIVQFYVDHNADLSKKNKKGISAAEILGKSFRK